MERITNHDTANWAETKPSEDEINAVYKRLQSLENVLGDSYDLTFLLRAVWADRADRLLIIPQGDLGDGEKALRKAVHQAETTNNPVNRYIAEAVAEKVYSEQKDADEAS